MANVLVDRKHLEAIANAIRLRYDDETATYTPAEMAPAILRIPGGEIKTVLSAIAITTPPYRTEYTSGEYFDTTGMVVTAYYTAYGLDAGEKVIDGYTVSPAPLTDEVTEVVISYTEGEVTKTVSIPVTVSAAIVGYKFTPPTRTEYSYGDVVERAGMSIIISYSDGTEENVSGKATLSPSILNTVTDNQTIVVTYNSQQWTYQVKVSKKKVDKPTYDGTTFTYDGNSKTPAISGYNSRYMTRSGDLTAAEAGTYTISYILNENYMWMDGTEGIVSITWTITKAKSTVTVSNTSLSLNPDAPAATLTLGGVGDGTIDTIYDQSVISVAIDGNNMTITRLEAAVDGNYILAIQRLEGKNYTESDSVMVSINVKSTAEWTWGSSVIGPGETPDATAQWFEELSEAIAKMTPAQRKELVGKGKRIADNGTPQNFTVQMSDGSTSTIPATIMVVGADHDGEGTLTFATAWVTSSTQINRYNTTSFGTVDMQLVTYCSRFYDNMPEWLKAHVVPVTRSTVRFTDKTWNVFPPSSKELGIEVGTLTQFPGNYLVPEDSTTIPYEYFTSNGSRQVYSSPGTIGYYGYATRNMAGDDGVWIKKTGDATLSDQSNMARMRYMFVFK